MPAVLAKAHADLDRAVDKCYRETPFKSERERVEYLFTLYENLANPLLPGTGKKGTRPHKSKESVPEKIETPIDFQETNEDADDGRTSQIAGPGGEKHWYDHILESNGAGFVDDALDELLEIVASYTSRRDFLALDEEISAVISKGERNPLPLLLGLLSATRAVAAHLPNRPKLRLLVETRLNRLGQDPKKALVGL
jgi:hypothetical protein